MTDRACIFCRVAAGEIPARILLEDEETVAFHDIDPKAPTHVLVIPRRHVASVADLSEADAALAGRLLLAAGGAARAAGLVEDGYRIVINSGADALQSVDHIHLHVLGGRKLGWPPG
jgi:histidine triad (HIT) family protein